MNLVKIYTHTHVCVCNKKMKSWNIRYAIYTCFTTTETLSLGLEMGCGYYVSRNKEATLCRLWPFSVFGARDPNSGTKIMHVQILSLGWQFNFNW
jgi:hypothetical protein